jgi:hypothetical protein
MEQRFEGNFFYLYTEWKKLVKCYIWSIALYGAETWALRAVDQKHLVSFEMLEEEGKDQLD